MKVSVRDGPQVRSARDVDIDRIREWLEEEDRLGLPGNFLCNWDTIVAHHRTRNVLIYVDDSVQIPSGFLAGGLTEDGILQVRNSSRWRGIGRVLVERALNDCEKGSILVIQCAPVTSVPFWQRMGFTMLPAESRDSLPSRTVQYAYRVVPRVNILPPEAEGRSVIVTIRFYPAARCGRDNVQATDTWSPRAVKTCDGTIHLGERILMVGRRIGRIWTDAVIELVVDGRTVYMDKARYLDAERLGVERIAEGFQLDCIYLT